MNHGDSGWNDLVIDDAASPAPLDEARYGQWLSKQRVFVSSVMDDELRPYREAARAYLEKRGGTAVMWETVAPRDQHPERAYLDGVDRSTLFVLMAGGRYGVADGTGYSPTHKETNRAEQRHLTRLLFTLPSSDRDGRLNDWIRSLYATLSGVKVQSPEHLAGRLDATLRELAARSARSWIKLGRFVFPGRVSRTAGPQTTARYTVTAQVTSNEVRQGLLGLGSQFVRSTMRLTWPDHSFPVQVEEVASESEFADEDAVKLTCQGVEDRGGGMMMMMNLNGVGVRDQAELWARRAILGEPYESRGIVDMLDSFTRPEGPTLPQVLADTEVTGWQAEGLVRLYAVEELRRKWGGSFDSIQVGPTTGRGVSLHAVARLPQEASNVSPERFELEGVLSIAGGADT